MSQCGDKQEQDKSSGGDTVLLTWRLSTIMGYMNLAGHREQWGGGGRGAGERVEREGDTRQ